MCKMCYIKWKTYTHKKNNSLLTYFQKVITKNLCSIIKYVKNNTLFLFTTTLSSSTDPK